MKIQLRRQFTMTACVLLMGVLPLSGTALAQSGAQPPPNVGSGDCDRACLQGLAEQYLAALVAHDPGKVALAKNVRYSENSVPLPIPDGFWKNATGGASLTVCT